MRRSCCKTSKCRDYPNGIWDISCFGLPSLDVTKIALMKKLVNVWQDSESRQHHFFILPAILSNTTSGIILSNLVPRTVGSGN